MRGKSVSYSYVFYNKLFLFKKIIKKSATTEKFANVHNFLNFHRWAVIVLCAGWSGIGRRFRSTLARFAEWCGVAEKKDNGRRRELIPNYHFPSAAAHFFTLAARPPFRAQSARNPHLTPLRSAGGTPTLPLSALLAEPPPYPTPPSWPRAARAEPPPCRAPSPLADPAP